MMKVAFIAAVALIGLSFLPAYGKDLIILKSGERVFCDIRKEDSLNLYITTSEQGRTSPVIALEKSKINSYQRNYKEEEKLTPIDSFYLFNDFTMTKSEYRARDSINYLEDVKLKQSLTFGICNGGSVVGLDWNALLYKNVGFQIGVGVVGYAVGVNIHTKPSARSSSLCLQYWHFGVTNNTYAALLTAAYCHRSRSGFTYQLGLGYVLDSKLSLSLFSWDVSTPDLSFDNYPINNANAKIETGDYYDPENNDDDSDTKFYPFISIGYYIAF